MQGECASAPLFLFLSAYSLPDLLFVKLPNADRPEIAGNSSKFSLLFRGSSKNYRIEDSLFFGTDRWTFFINPPLPLPVNPFGNNSHHQREGKHNVAFFFPRDESRGYYHCTPPECGKLISKLPHCLISKLSILPKTPK